MLTAERREEILSELIVHSLARINADVRIGIESQDVFKKEMYDLVRGLLPHLKITEDECIELLAPLLLRIHRIVEMNADTFPVFIKTIKQWVEKDGDGNVVNRKKEITTQGEYVPDPEDPLDDENTELDPPDEDWDEEGHEDEQ